VIVCLVEDAVATAGWILDVPHDRLAVVRRGAGVTLDGAAVRGKPPDRPPTGFVGYKIAREFDRQLDKKQRARLGRVSTLACAGAEYLEILSGRASFSLYRTTKPWDHAAGSLMMTEAGGGAVRFDGAPYSPAQAPHAGLIAASSSEVLDEVRAVFEAARLPLLAPRS
jgi:fructose-1,6-bisphosphatase/inositol monophosphatase family enzyme